MKLAYGIFCAPMLVGVLQWANTPLEFIVLLGAAIAAIGMIWARVILPVIRFIASAGDAIETIRNFHEYQSEVRTRLQVIEGALYGMDHIDSMTPVRRRGDNPRHDDSQRSDS